jgi:hypothetical protein
MKPNRGVNAEAASMLEVTERDISSMHSRQTREFSYVRHIPEPQQISNRKFRPTATTKNAAKSILVPVVPTTCQQPQALDQLTHSHLNNIWRSLEHRLQVAKTKGDTKLVRLLEAESKQMKLTLP